MMPVPSHLKGIVVPKDTRLDEESLDAWVRCPCGCEEFILLYTGQTVLHEGCLYAASVVIEGESYFLIRCRCAQCHKESLLFDEDFHGWDGWVCHKLEKAARARPALVPWKCPTCNSEIHLCSVQVCTEGRADFAEYAADDAQFPVNRWPDGFGWFDLCTECVHCGQGFTPWVTRETM